MLGRTEIQIIVIDDWPRIKLIIQSPTGVRTESAMYDVAPTVFEPFVKDVVTKAVQTITQKRKQERN